MNCEFFCSHSVKNAIGNLIGITLNLGTSMVAQLVKNMPAMQETWVQSLDWEDFPGAGKAYPLHYSGLENTGHVPWTEEPGRLQPMGLQRIRHK